MLLYPQTIILKKRSEYSFIEVFILNSTGFGLLSLFYLIFKKKFDSISLSENNVCFKFKNKVTFQKTYAQIQSVRYNAAKETLQINTGNNIYSLSLKVFRITYDEAKVLRHHLSTFNKCLKRNT